MSPRADLLELTPEALTALSNAGFVKRAQKDVAEGKLPTIEQKADGTVVARYDDGTLTALAPSKPLREASCSCPASGLCRHRVTLVLAYQAQAGQQDNSASEPVAWSPAHFEEVVQLLPRATLEQARRLAASRPAIRLTAAHPPGARLPMCDVRFLSRTSLALARCDCTQGENCAHIAVAVWAFAQAQRQQPGFDSMTIELETPTSGGGAAKAEDEAAAAAAEVAITALANQLWLDGTAQNPLALATLFEQASQQAARLGWSWVVEALDQLRQGVAGQHARASSADPARLLQLLSTLIARLGAARAATLAEQSAIPARQILGVGVKGEVALDHLRLVPLGSCAWADDSGDGVRMIWADPDTLAVTVLEKRWPPPVADATPTALRDRRLLAQPLHRLAASQIVTKAAKRRANGLLTIGSTAAQTSVLPLSMAAWDQLTSPLRQQDLPSLRAYLRSLPPDFVRPLQAIEHVHVLPIAQVIECTWDAASQCVNAYVLIGTEAPEEQAPDQEDESGDEDNAWQAFSQRDTLLLQLRFDKATPGAVDALAHALGGTNGTPIAVAGSVATHAGRLCMTPLAVLTTNGLTVPQLASAVPAHNLPGTDTEYPDELSALLERACETLAQCLRLGLRHQSRSAFERALEHVAALRAAGLVRCADALAAAFDVVKGGETGMLASRLAALYALLHVLGDEIMNAPGT